MFKAKFSFALVVACLIAMKRYRMGRVQKTAKRHIKSLISAPYFFLI